MTAATLSLREEFGAIIPSIGIESNARGGTRVRGGWRLGDLLPDPIRRIIQGFYIEGFFNTGGGFVLFFLPLSFSRSFQPCQFDPDFHEFQDP